ncbi:MAG TPA: hypothetical protein VEA81_09085, partial [Burkholderiaceae bacterium]|nr:hypothetical protein [Burkholderiaceae bacterium]
MPARSSRSDAALRSPAFGSVVSAWIAGAIRIRQGRNEIGPRHSSITASDEGMPAVAGGLDDRCGDFPARPRRGLIARWTSSPSPAPCSP